MKMHKWLIASLLILGTLAPSRTHESVDDSFRPYLEDFLKGAKDAGVYKTIESRLQTLIIKFENVKQFDKDYIGFCHPDNQVWVDEQEWRQASHNRRQALIDHELGHCLLGRIHRHKAHYQRADGRGEILYVPYRDALAVAYSVPPRDLASKDYYELSSQESIMYSKVATGEYYGKHKAKLRKELFNKKYLDNHKQIMNSIMELGKNPEFKEVNVHWLTIIAENRINKDIEK